VRGSHAGPGEVRVRVAAAGLNPMDWGISSIPEAAAMFGVTVPAGFGYDFAGVVDEVGDSTDGFAVGDRVYGGMIARAAADFLVMKAPAPAPDALFRKPDGISDEVAATLPVAGLTAAAALQATGLRPGGTVLVGGAAGGVGVFVVQLAKLAGATVIGTAWEGTFELLRQLGAEPVAYGPRLADRVRTLAPGGVTRRRTCSAPRRPRRRSRSAYRPSGSPRSPQAPIPRRRARDLGQRSRTGRPGAGHRRDPRRKAHRAHRRGLPDRADPRRRGAAGPTPRPRQDRCTL